MNNIDDMTIGQFKQFSALLGGNNQQLSSLSCANSTVPESNQQSSGLNSQLGEKVIIRTYSAGVWFGTLEQKDGSEVILQNARRMWRWWAEKSISLSGVAVYGINADKSKICPAIETQWLEAIEIISLTKIAIDSIEGADDVAAS